MERALLETRMPWKMEASSCNCCVFDGSPRSWKRKKGMTGQDGVHRCEGLLAGERAARESSGGSLDSMHVMEE